jgi:aryl-alcohol dehydrogenase-like predicted oxidoreductase
MGLERVDDNESPGSRAAGQEASVVLNGAALPRVILGTANLGSILPDAFVTATDRERAFRYLDEMLEAGCSAFDTAASYQIGGTERLIGGWMSSRKNRGRLFLITKGCHPYPVVQPNRLTPKALEGDLKDSLRRLRIERADLYLLHRDALDSPLEPIVESLATLQRRGQIGAWGVSNWSHDRIQKISGLARAAGLSPPAASSPHFSLAEWTSAAPWKGSVSIAGDAGRDARAFHRLTQLPVLAWSPLGRGFFSGGAEQRADPRAYGSPSNVARRHRAEALARKYEVTLAQIALAYLFNQPFPVLAIVATGTAAKMRTNLEATRLRLPESEVRWLESGDDSGG